MDDKRTLLAFLLVGLIFLLMPYYYELMGLTPPPQERVDDEVVETPRDVDFPSPRRSAARDAALAVPRSSAAALPSPAAALEGGAVLGTHPPAREVVIENDRLRLVFSSRGGVLVRAELLEYHRPDGLVVDLIPAGGQGLGLTLRSDAGD